QGVRAVQPGDGLAGQTDPPGAALLPALLRQPVGRDSLAHRPRHWGERSARARTWWLGLERGDGENVAAGEWVAQVTFHREGIRPGTGYTHRPSPVRCPALAPLCVR